MYPLVERSWKHELSKRYLLFVLLMLAKSIAEWFFNFVKDSSRCFELALISVVDE
jgi:hypothetical protein